jgi:histidyl-tRNA synthetase
MRALYEDAARLAELFGYRYMETAVLEPTELFTRTSGETSDVVRKETYSFTDRGGRSLTLRPEGTAPAVRALLANPQGVATPFKGYYVELEWRYGRPQSGRLREFRVFGVEVFGEADPGADVEVMVVADRYLRDTGLARFDLEINSIGDENCRPAYREELVAYLEANRERMTDEHRDRFRENPLRVLDCKDQACTAVSERAPMIVDRLCGPCKEHFAEVLSGLRDEGVPCRETPRLVRGLDYYTRTAFEFVSSSTPGAQATLCGGGRYDGLAEVLGGPRTPAVGFGLGLDRVALALEAEGVEAPATRGPECFVVAVSDPGRAWSVVVSRFLRAAGIAAASSFGARSLKAQLRMADRSDAPFAVIIGEREATARTVTLRRLQDGDQRQLGLDEAVAWIAAQRPAGPAIREARR